MSVEIAHQIEIAAPYDEVWDVLSDIQAWPTWTPTVEKVVAETPGPVNAGSTFELFQPKMLPAAWEITSWIPGRGFTWESHGLGLVTTAEHALESRGAVTVVTLKITFSGPLGGLIGFLSGTFTKNYLTLEAAGLKRRVEHSPGNPST